MFDLETHGNAVFGPPFLNSILSAGQPNRGPASHLINEENLSGSMGNMLNINTNAPSGGQHTNYERTNSNPACSYAHIPYLDYRYLNRGSMNLGTNYCPLQSSIHL